MTRIDISGEIKPAQADLFGEVPGTLARVKAQMERGPAPYEVHVNSPGGSYEEALAVRSLLSEHECKVIIDAACYSAATLFLTLGEVTMRPGTLLMFHAPSAYASGTAAELGDAVTYLNTVRASAAALYASKTGKTAEEMDALMSGETWLTPDKAKEMGFCDIVDGAPVEAVALVRSLAGMKLSATAPDLARMIADPVAYVAGLFGTEANPEAIAERMAAMKKHEADAAEMRATVSETAAKLLAETEAHKTTAAELAAAKDAVLRFDEKVAKRVAQLAAAAHVAPVPLKQEPESPKTTAAELAKKIQATTDPKERAKLFKEWDALTSN